MVVTLSETVRFLPESAPVTDWPLRLLLLTIMLVMIGLVLFQLRRRWVRLEQESEGIYPAPPTTAPAEFIPDVEVVGLFLGSSPVGQWMKKIMAHGLGVRSRATLLWAPRGVAFQRQGELNFFIGAEDILAAGFGRGVAGTVRAKDSVLVIRWKLGEAILDSGFRADTSEGHQALMQIQQMIEAQARPAT